MKKRLGAFGVLLVIALSALAAPATATATVAPAASPSAQARTALGAGVSAIRHFRANHGHLPGDLRGNALVASADRRVTAWFGRAEGGFCVLAVHRDTPRRPWFYDSARHEAFRASWSDLDQHPGACLSAVYPAPSAAVLRETALYDEARALAQGVGAALSAGQPLPTALDQTTLDGLGLALAPEVSVSVYEVTSEPLSLYRFCVVHSGGGWATYDAASGSVTHLSATGDSCTF